MNRLPPAPPAADVDVAGLVAECKRTIGFALDSAHADGEGGEKFHSDQTVRHTDAAGELIDKLGSAALAQPKQPDAAAVVLDEIGAAMGIGSKARSLATIMQCIQNAQRRADCLSTIEHKFFMVMEKDGDGEDSETCLLNWGHDPHEYAEAFRSALDVIRPARMDSPSDCHGLDTTERVRFYEHDFYVLSNFSAFRLTWNGVDFDTSEHAYHWEKFHGHPGIQRAIKDARSAHEAFKLAERHRHDRRFDWDDAKVEIMRRILRAKAAQHEYVRRKLLATGDRELVEDSWRDDFWGWGPNQDGLNMLGKLWMEIRAELRAALAGEKGAA